VSAHLVVALHPYEIEVISGDQLFRRFVVTNMGLQLPLCQPNIVALDLANVVGQPLKSLFNVLFRHFRSQAHDFGLIHMLDIHTELFLPLLHTDRSGVHTKAASAYEPVFLSV
jgi:hypothetical protein